MRRDLISTEDQGLVFPNLHEDPSLLLALSPITICVSVGSLLRFMARRCGLFGNHFIATLILIPAARRP